MMGTWSYPCAFVILVHAKCLKLVSWKSHKPTQYYSLSLSPSLFGLLPLCVHLLLSEVTVLPYCFLYLSISLFWSSLYFATVFFGIILFIQYRCLCFSSSACISFCVKHRIISASNRKERKGKVCVSFCFVLFLCLFFSFSSFAFYLVKICLLSLRYFWFYRGFRVMCTF